MSEAALGWEPFLWIKNAVVSFLCGYGATHSIIFEDAAYENFSLQSNQRQVLGVTILRLTPYLFGRTGFIGTGWFFDERVQFSCCYGILMLQLMQKKRHDSPPQPANLTYLDIRPPIGPAKNR